MIEVIRCHSGLAHEIVKSLDELKADFDRAEAKCKQTDEALKAHWTREALHDSGEASVKFDEAFAALNAALS